MAVPTIASISPSIGHTSGGDLIEIRGTGFRTWTVPAPTGAMSAPPWPTVEVLFGGVRGNDIAVISDTRLFIRPPRSPISIARPSYGEGPVDVVIRNLTDGGVPRYGEWVTAAGGFAYQRTQLATQSDFTRITREIIRQFRLQVIDNVSSSTHTDFDINTSDDLSTVDIASVPAVVVFGPTLRENRFFSVHGPVYGVREGYESDLYKAPETDDLIYQVTGISDQKQEALELQGLIRQFFKRNKYLYLDRDPTDKSKGIVRYDFVWDASAMPFNSPGDQKSNLRTFSGTFFVRGFDHESLPGFPYADRVARIAQATTPIPPDTGPVTPPTPPSTTKTIVDFVFPEGTGTITGNTITVRVPPGTDLSRLVPTIVHTGASISPVTGVMQDFSNPVDYTVTAADGSTKTYTVNVLFSIAPGDLPGMQVGTNFWYHTQRNLQDPAQENWSGEEAMIAGINWATAYGPGTGGVGAANIWNPTWLAELAPYSVLRFMDWNNINWAQIVNWSDRMLPTSPDNVEQYSDQDTIAPNPGMAYEWMIDLCNRTAKDLWICVPHTANDDYWTQLATLVLAKLSSSRKVYLEYSNETWNGTFEQQQYTIDQGVSLDLPAPGPVGDPGRPYYQGQAYALRQSLRLFKTFSDVFGSSSMGTRVFRVLGVGGNHDLMSTALQNLYTSSTYNPDSQTVDMLVMAPYIGPDLDGSSPTIQSQFHTEIDQMFAPDVVDNFHSLQTIAAAHGIGTVGTYEGGQHLFDHSRQWAVNPLIYDEYRYLLDKLRDIGCKVFMHYTHTGRWSTDATKPSWGAVDHTGQPISEAHKYRALLDFVLGNS